MTLRTECDTSACTHILIIISNYWHTLTLISFIIVVYCQCWLDGKGGTLQTWCEVFDVENLYKILLMDFNYLCALVTCLKSSSRDIVRRHIHWECDLMHEKMFVLIPFILWWNLELLFMQIVVCGGEILNGNDLIKEGLKLNVSRWIFFLLNI